MPDLAHAYTYDAIQVTERLTSSIERIQAVIVEDGSTPYQPPAGIVHLSNRDGGTALVCEVTEFWVERSQLAVQRALGYPAPGKRVLTLVGYHIVGAEARRPDSPSLPIEIVDGARAIHFGEEEQ